MSTSSKQQEDLERAAKILAPTKHVLAFTGAGISKESGIDTFRDEGGLWDAFDMAEFGTPGGIARLLAKNPRRLAEFIEAILVPIAQADPNAAHHALKKLEETHDVSIVTQNVDGLHQQAGSTLVREVHGSLHRIVDSKGNTVRRLSSSDLQEIATSVAKIKSGRLPRWRLMRAIRSMLGLSKNRLSIGHRPNLVLFGEQLAEPDWDQAQEDARSCDAVVVVGTSGEVYPAASLPEVVRDRGRPLIVVGPEPADADVWLEGPAGELLPQLVERIAQLTVR